MLNLFSIDTALLFNTLYDFNILLLLVYVILLFDLLLMSIPFAVIQLSLMKALICLKSKF